ncbi:MAG: epimerase [Chloroflexi bacterium RBG_16_56_11]|nr:MAG: epimerase [Chloroflexi bacterium RBG_16_56_11]
MKEAVLVTGVAGFIGSHLGERLLRLGYSVVGLDNLDSFYDPAIKRENIRALEDNSSFRMIRGDIRDKELLNRIFSENSISLVAHLAARAGVRPSLQLPLLYQDVNIGGTINMLEASRSSGVRQFVFASSSSVYGLNSRVPFREDDKIDYPTSPYAASKSAGELFCRTYHHLYGLPVKALRLFTVYGPRQRPEMAIHSFARKIEAGEEIPVYGDGTAKRDYTYIDDIIDGIMGALTSRDPGFQIYNLGDSSPIDIMSLVRLLEKSLGKTARVKNLPQQPGDVPITYADISRAGVDLGYRPAVPIERGVELFVRWYRQSVARLAGNVAGHTN